MRSNRIYDYFGLSRCFLLICGLFLPIMSAAETPRDTITIHGPRIHLSDLFDNLEPGQDQEIGNAPHPGQSIFVPGKQLKAIAHDYNIEDTDISETDHLKLTRSGRILIPDDILPTLEDALHEKGLSEKSNIKIDHFPQNIFIAEKIDVSPDLTSLVWNSHNGHFSAFFTIKSEENSERTSIQISGNTLSYASVISATHDIAPGEMITTEDLEFQEKDTRLIPTLALHDMTMIQGQTARRLLRAGNPITSDDIRQITLIERNAPVVLVVSSQGLQLTAAGRALGSASIGQRVRVLNTASHMIVTGLATDRTHVAVEPGTAPEPADPQLINSLHAQRLP